MQWLGWVIIVLLWMTGVLILWFKAPPVPSRKQAIEDGLRAAEIKPDDLVVDLGAGDGRVLQMARDEYRAKVAGWELHPLLWLLAKMRLGWRAEIRLANLWQASIQDADVVFVFLMPHLMRRVEQEIWPRMKPGARLVSNSFNLPNIQPTVKRGRAYVYVRPGQVG